MIAVFAIVGALAVLAFWTLVLWIGARLDQDHLDREQAERALAGVDRNG